MIDIPLARRVRGVAPSAVREILKVAERPDVLSFAGGLPAPELFPTREIAAAFEAVLGSAAGPAALQYGVTEGFLPLRAWVAESLRARGIPSSPEHLVITSGAQQGIGRRIGHRRAPSLGDVPSDDGPGRARRPSKVLVPSNGLGMNPPGAAAAGRSPPSNSAAGNPAPPSSSLTCAMLSCEYGLFSIM
jgi:hypothetical protein